MNIFGPVLTAKGSPGRELDHMPASVVRILEGAIRAISSHGSRRLSMSDISDASGVSRGTLYRYFSTKEDVLAAVGEYISINFELGVREIASQHHDPIARFQAVMQYFSSYTVERTPERLFEVEPAFYLEFFRSHFDRHKQAVGAALAPTFDAIEQAGGMKLDRAAVAEALVRLQLSSLIVPADSHWDGVWERSPAYLERWIGKLGGWKQPDKEE